MAEESSQPVRTFSIGFEDAAYDELPYARAVAQQFGDRSTREEVVRLDAIGLLPDLADHFDEPFGDSSAIPTFRVVADGGRSDLKVVLTGDGGDESFGGYTRYRVHGSFGALDRIRGPTPLRRRGPGRPGCATPLGSASPAPRRRMTIAEGLFEP